MTAISSFKRISGEREIGLFQVSLFFVNRTCNMVRYCPNRLVALGEVTTEIISGSPHFFSINPMDYGRLLVISLGTGSRKLAQQFNGDDVAKWSRLDWLRKGGSAPLIDAFTEASSDMVDYHNCTVFEALQKLLRNKIKKIKCGFRFLCDSVTVEN
ncbi:hypothetical protein RJ641_029116 [Dillenia turbinata]|uniref:Uncharacterized protein n=1 Tax=Dillenia turbinata TaxID=194707 RepID=A0AAN8ZMM5_9MAGN